MAFANAATLTFAKDQIAIGLTRGAFGSHIGIAFHTVKDGVRLLHLHFHRHLGVDAFPVEGQCWIATVPELHKTNSKILVGIVRFAASRKQSINFGINLLASHGSFDANGHYTAPRGSDGLTCATFVSELLRATGLPLVNLQSWQPRDEDVAWGNNVCTLLRDRGRASPEHIAVVRANINGLRLRPEEVAFAADQPLASRPVDFVSATAGGSAVMTRLNSICPVINLMAPIQA